MNEIMQEIRPSATAQMASSLTLIQLVGYQGEDYIWTNQRDKGWKFCLPCHPCRFICKQTL